MSVQAVFVPRTAGTSKCLATCIAVAAAITATGLARAGSEAPLAVETASSKQLYDELVGRTTNMLAAPAEELTWSKLDFKKPTIIEQVPRTLSPRSGLLSVYDDSAKGTPSPRTGPLSTASDAELGNVLRRRTANIQKTVYGSDRRMDLYTAISKRDQASRVGASALEATYVNNAEAVGFILDLSLLRKLPSGDFYVRADTYGVVNRLCKVENFWDQPCVDVIGTGFLIAPDRFCTAGHCIPPNADIKRLRVVFGYSLLSPQIPESIIVKADDVYLVDRIISERLTGDAEDWAVVRLNRNSARAALRLGSGYPKVNSRVFAIGYPAGLPLKISPNAEVRSGVGKNRCFIAAVDVYGGNSGSPIMSEETGKVEGILVRGDEDFRMIPTGQCLASVVINDAHSGESVCSVASIPR